MALKTYILSFANSITHVPECPERTAMKSLEWDVRYQVWTSRAAMLKTIDMQGRSAPRQDHWRACRIPANA
jgi:phosphopantetheinyl transferase